MIAACKSCQFCEDDISLLRWWFCFYIVWLNRLTRFFLLFLLFRRWWLQHVSLVNFRDDDMSWTRWWFIFCIAWFNRRYFTNEVMLLFSNCMVEPSNTSFTFFFPFSSMMIIECKSCQFSRRRYFTNEVMVLFSHCMLEPSNTSFLLFFLCRRWWLQDVSLLNFRDEYISWNRWWFVFRIGWLTV